MRFYKFKTFKSTFFFPQRNSQTRFIYSLYGNYGGKAAHLFWWAFQHIAPIRWMNCAKIEEIDNLSTIQSLLGDNCVFGINMGTNGPDQKKSILGYDTSTGDRFFAKFATKPRAMALSRNEIKVYEQLSDTSLVPRLFDYHITDNYVFMKCECISGSHVHGQIDISQVMSILKTLKQKHYSTTPQPSSLETCFTHMDFCPWNMIDVNGKLHIIDWEMAAEMPLGFDLFTYLLQTHFLTVNSMTGQELITNNVEIINDYFQCPREAWQPYLDAFVQWKIDFFSAGQNDLLLTRFKEMSSGDILRENNFLH